MSAMKGSRRSLGGWMAVVGLCAYSLLFYRSVLFGERVYVFRDLVTFFYSIEHLARLLASYDWPPPWNPFVVLGKPFAADPLSGVYYPPNWILRQLPVALGFNLSLAAHHAAAAVGMYLLARRLDLSLAAAALAGLLYGFGGPLVSCDNVYNALLAATWAPWAILAFLRWPQRPGLERLTLVAAALALSLLGAMPEVTLFTGLVLLGVALDGSGAASRGARVITLAMAVLWALALCGAPLLSGYQYIAESSRAGGLNVANALQNSLAPSGLLSFLVPRALGDWNHAPWLLTLYFGPALALAVLAPTLLPRGRRWWVAVPLVFLCLSLGENLPGYAWAIERVAWLRIVRYPEKFLLAVHGFLALAAGAGLEVLLRRGASYGRTLAAAVLLLTAADLYRANADLLPIAAWSEVIARPASARLMETGDDPLRIYSNGVGIPELAPYPEGLRLEKDLLLFQTANLVQIANLNAPATINLTDHEALEQVLETVPHERVATLLGAFNTAYLTSVRALERPDLSLVRAPSTALQVHVYRVEPLAPRLFVPPRARAAANADEALAALRQGPSPAEEVILEGAPPSAPLAAMAGKVELLRYQPTRVEARATMDTPGFVVLSDTFSTDWGVTVDAAPATLLRANRFARAVAVPAGEHRIVFEYDRTRQAKALAISIAALLVLPILVCGAWLRRRRSDRSGRG